MTSPVHSFSETDKLDYGGVRDDGRSIRVIHLARINLCIANMFHFTCFNVEDPNDESVGLVDGQLSIPGVLLRREVYVVPGSSRYAHLSYVKL